MLEERRPDTGTGRDGRVQEETAVPGLRRITAEPAVAARPPSAASPPSVYRDWVVWGIAGAVFGAYLTISLYRLFQLNPSSWDLGIFTEYVKQYASLRAPIVDIRGAGFNLLGDHFQVIVAVIAPFFRIFPSPATLLVAQALLTAVSVFPVSQAASEKLGTGAGRAIGAAYGFSWGLQQMADFDFHEIAFAVPLLAFSLSALIRGRLRAAVLWALPLVFVKEDQGFTLAAMGLVMIYGGWRARDRDEAAAGARTRAGLFLLAWGLAWSLLAITVIIPHFNAGHHYLYWGEGGVVAPGGHFSVAGAATQVFHAWPVKLQTVVLLLLATAFIALDSPVAFVALPSLGLRFINTNPNYWGTMWHYNATVMPILFIAAIDAMARARAGREAGDAGEASAPAAARAAPQAGAPAAAGAAAEAGAVTEAAAVTEDGPEPGEGAQRSGWLWPLRAAAERHGAAMMLAIAAALAFQFPLSSIWNGQTYEIGPHVTAAEAAMAQVPDGATVQTTLDLLAPLAARTDTFWIGNSGNPYTQYIVFDGANSGYTPAPADVPTFIRQMYPKAGYTQIFESDDVYVFHRAG